MGTTQIAETDIDGQKLGAPLLLPAEKVAQLLGISVRTLWRLRAAGKLPAPVRVGGSVRWRLDEISLWIEAGCPNAIDRSKNQRVWR